MTQPTSHSMSDRPVLILFANLKGNLGDLAILYAMLVFLEKQFPGAPRHVFSHGHKAVDEIRMKRFLEQAHPAFDYKGLAPYHKIRRRWSFLRYLGLHEWFKGYLIDRLSARFARMEPFRSMGGYQAIFLAGGEQWGGFSAGINMFATVDAVYHFNSSIFIFPFSVRKHVLEGYSLERLQSCFGKISGNVVVRDRLSGQSMREITLRTVDGVDCVFSLADCVSAASSSGVGRDEVIVTIAVTEEKDGSKTEDMIDAIKRLKDKGIVVRLLTTCEEEDGASLGELSVKLGVESINPATWQEVVAEFRKSTLVVTNRLHCMIFTFFADVPVIPLINREKVHGVCGDAGLDCHIRHLNELTAEKVSEYKNRSAEIRGTMRRYLEATGKIYADTMTVEGDDSSGV